MEVTVQPLTTSPSLLLLVLYNHGTSSESTPSSHLNSEDRPFAITIYHYPCMHGKMADDPKGVGSKELIVVQLLRSWPVEGAAPSQSPCMNIPLPLLLCFLHVLLNSSRTLSSLFFLLPMTTVKLLAAEWVIVTLLSLLSQRLGEVRM